MGYKELSADFKAARAALAGVACVHNLEQNDFSVGFDFGDDETHCEIVFSETYPKGEAMVLGDLPDSFQSISVAKALGTLLTAMCQDAGLAVPPQIAALGDSATPAAADEPGTLERQATSGSDVVEQEWDGAARNESAERYLAEEIDAARLRFGAGWVSESRTATGDIILRVGVPLPKLDRQMCEIYGLHVGSRIVIQLDLVAPHYLQSSKKPQVHLFQTPAKALTTGNVEERSFGLKWQCEKRVERFLSQSAIWPNALRHDETIQQQEKQQRAQREAEAAAETAKPRTRVPRCPKKVDIKKVEAMVDMGFDRAVSMIMLQVCKNDVMDAVHMISTDQYIGIFQEREHTLYRDADAPPVTIVDVPLNFKTRFNFFLLNLADYVDWCMHTCNQRCIICDMPLSYQGLKPSICDRALCNFSYEQYGLGSDLASEIRYSPELIDMLITLCAGAVVGTNREANFDPFPHGVKADIVEAGRKKGEVGFREKVKDFALLEKVIASFPSVEEMRKFATAEEDLRDHLVSRHPLCYSLLKWLVTSNRAHIQALPPPKQIKGIGTNFQFLMLSSPPEKEAKFRQAKAQYGSHYVFHGSGFWNWHSILRIGLKNFSNTSRMTAGAAYGPGIYLAQNLNVSSGYMGQGTGWNRSQFGSQCMQCCVVAEAIKIKSYDKGGGIYVVPEEDHVVTRYFLIFSSNSQQYVQRQFDAHTLTPPSVDYFS